MRRGELLTDSHETSSCERDLDVLWIGKRRTRRRSATLDRSAPVSAARGATMHVVDGIEQPFVFGRARTVLLNRATITLNILPTWYDGALSYRFPLAAANRSLVVSEVALPHAPHLRPNVHYVEAAPANWSTPFCTTCMRPRNASASSMPPIARSSTSTRSSTASPRSCAQRSSRPRRLGNHAESGCAQRGVRTTTGMLRVVRA